MTPPKAADMAGWGEPTSPWGPTNRVQDAVAWLLETACEATGHAGGCALLRGPAVRLWSWSLGDREWRIKRGPRSSRPSLLRRFMRRLWRRG